MSPRLTAVAGCRLAPIPPVEDLTWEQSAGRACYACGRPLMHGAISGGWAVGRLGAHALNVEVWACP